jgi:hypothetical protein
VVDKGFQRRVAVGLSANVVIRGVASPEGASHRVRRGRGARSSGRAADRGRFCALAPAWSSWASAHITQPTSFQASAASPSQPMVSRTVLAVLATIPRRCNHFPFMIKERQRRPRSPERPDFRSRNRGRADFRPDRRLRRRTRSNRHRRRRPDAKLTIGTSSRVVKAARGLARDSCRWST